MTQTADFKPRRFAVIGAGPVGSIVAAFLARGGHDVTLCDVVPELLTPALDPGIRLEGAENFQQKVTRTCQSVDDLAEFAPEVIFVTVKANALPLIASAIEGFWHEGMLLVSWQNGIDTELELAKTLGRGPVLRAVVNYGCGLVAPGHVRIPFHHPPHYLQELDPQAKDAAQGIARVLSECGLHDRAQRPDRLHGLAQDRDERLHEPGLRADGVDHVARHERPHRAPDRGFPGEGVHPGGPGQ